MKKSIFIILMATLLATTTNAETMQHWAYVRDDCGNLIGTVDAYSDVQVYGICEDNPARSYVYIPETGTYGTIASVYIYGGTDYEYENPLEYSYGTYCPENPLEYSYNTYSPENNYDSWDTPTYDEYAETYNYGSYSVGGYEYDAYTDPVAYNTAPADTHYGYIPEYGTEEYWDWLDVQTDESGSIAYYDNEYNQWLPSQINYQTEPARYGEGEIWIDVNLSSQTLSVYSGGEVLVSGLCVTGQPGELETPVGTHYVMAKEAGATLRDDNPDGTPYACPVDFWMPFTESGCGIHDSDRAAFGGDIYMTSGSYGCVNAPWDLARDVFNLADVGTRIEVHW